MDINLFKFCSALKVLGYFMILLVSAIIAVTYYAVVVLTWAPQLLRGGIQSLAAFAVLLAFHVLLVMLLWSYFMVVLTDPGSVPENWRLVEAEDNLEAGSSSTLREDAVEEIGLDRRRDGRYCARCENWKPPRCHHSLSVCQRCILKMDHHCVWVVNCVGARNYKFFLLFLGYTFLESIVDILVLLPSVVEHFVQAIHNSSNPGNLAVLFLAFVLNLAFALSLLCFIVMHASLLSSNTTSVEVYERKGAVRWKYDLGRERNFQQVFGTRKVLWFFPVFSREDLDNVPGVNGLNFPIRSDMEV